MNFNNNEYRPNSFGYLPVVTKNIIVINILLFAATYVLRNAKGIDLVEYLGLHYHLAADFKPHQFITYIFMHGNLGHIFFNMFGVFIFGQVLEQVWGPKRYLIFYLLTGLGAALTQYIIMHVEIQNVLSMVNAEINSSLTSAHEKTYLINQKFDYLNRHVIIGASGSLFGLLGGFGMLFPNRKLYLYFFIPVKAKWLVIGYGALEILSGIRNNPGDNVAHFAHIGGLAVGVLLVLLWRKNREHFY
jgi:membrane associated rhomboid family serine protease